MAARRQHHDVFFRIVSVETGPDGKTRRSWEETAGIALRLSVKTGRSVSVFVLVASKSGAEWYAGMKGLARYVWLREQPEYADTSHVVLEQIAIHCAARRTAKLPPALWLKKFRKARRKHLRQTRMSSTPT